MVLYRITNRTNGKIYIGITRWTAKRRFGGHLADMRKGANRPLHNALRKYPIDSWRVETIGSAASWEALCFMEAEEIRRQRSTDPAIGYNLTAGGDGQPGYKQSAEHRETRAAKLRGVPRPPDVRAKISAGNKGKSKSAEHVAKSLATRRAMKFKKTPQQIEKSASFHRGRKNTPETIRKMSEARSRYYMEKRNASLPNN